MASLSPLTAGCTLFSVSTSSFCRIDKAARIAAFSSIRARSLSSAPCSTCKQFARQLGRYFSPNSVPLVASEALPSSAAPPLPCPSHAAHFLSTALSPMRRMPRSADGTMRKNHSCLARLLCSPASPVGQCEEGHFVRARTCTRIYTRTQTQTQTYVRHVVHFELSRPQCVAAMLLIIHTHALTHTSYTRTS